jgi:hypothetical protein
MTTTPLWVPLKGKHFDAFADGSKTTEYRRLGGPLGQLKRLPVGRPVTLSRGYSGPRLHMVIKAVSVVSARSVPGCAELYGRRAHVVAIELEPAPRDGPPSRMKRTFRDGPGTLPLDPKRTSHLACPRP